MIKKFLIISFENVDIPYLKFLISWNDKSKLTALINNYIIRKQVVEFFPLSKNTYQITWDSINDFNEFTHEELYVEIINFLKIHAVEISWSDTLI